MTDTDPYSEAQQAQQLLGKIHDYAYNAVKYGKVDRDWVNGSLVRLGAKPISTRARYQLNIPITGLLGQTVTASSRDEARKIFQQSISHVFQDQPVDGSRCLRVFQVEAQNDDIQFFSGPQDVQVPEEPVVLTLAELKAAIRHMLKTGVSQHGWGHSYAVDALDTMGIEPLPALVQKSVDVPVSGTYRLSVEVFEGDTDEAVQAAATSALKGAQTVPVKPEEVGEAQWARSSGETMGLHLVGGDQEDDEVF